MPIYIYGCGGHARSVCGVLKKNQENLNIILVDSQAKENEEIIGVKTLKILPNNEKYMFYAIGDNKRRKDMFLKSNERVINIISTQACLGAEIHLGKGIFIGNFVNVGTEAYIDDNCIINTGAIIEHECVIGKHTHIAPKACVCGRSIVGDNVFIGAGTTIIDKISVCSDVIVGAGAVVINNIDEPGIYVGNPAKRIK